MACKLISFISAKRFVDEQTIADCLDFELKHQFRFDDESLRVVKRVIGRKLLDLYTESVENEPFEPYGAYVGLYVPPTRIGCRIKSFQMCFSTKLKDDVLNG